MTVRIGLMGAGRRMSTIYVPLLEKLQGAVCDFEVVGFTTRSEATAEAFSDSAAKRMAIRHCKTRDELATLKPDFMLVCVKSTAAPEVLRSSLRYGIPLLVETPMEDPSILADVEKSGVTVGVVEQWPYLPLEQFKEQVYQSGLIQRPYLVQNDCRSFDYHAIAQLRTYLGRGVKPVQASGTRVAARLEDHLNGDGNVVRGAIDSWELGTIQFENGSALVHQFAYACKTAPFRSIQSLRAYSPDGTIVTGRIDDRDNDYEIIDIEYLDDDKRTRRLGVTVQRNAFGTDEISAYVPDYTDMGRLGRQISWVNPIRDIHLSDGDQAIAAHLTRMMDAVQHGKKPLYDIKDAVMDQFLVSAIKHSCNQRQAVRLG